jgi:hypothetical protein
MDLLVIALFAITGFFFSAISIAADSKIFAVFAASAFISLGLILIVQGVDVVSGQKKVCNQINTTEVNQSICVDFSTENHYTTLKNIYTNSLGLLFILLSIFFFSMPLWGVGGV